MNKKNLRIVMDHGDEDYYAVYDNGVKIFENLVHVDEILKALGYDVEIDHTWLEDQWPNTINELDL